MEDYYEEDGNKVKYSFWWYVKTTLMMIPVTVFLVFLILFIFCRSVEEGIVITKEFAAAYDENITSDYTSETDKYEIYRHYPDIYSITVSGTDWFGRKQKSTTYYVLKERYENLEIGDYWKLTDGLDYSAPPKYWEDPIPEELSEHSNGYHVIVIPHPLG